MPAAAPLLVPVLLPLLIVVIVIVTSGGRVSTLWGSRKGGGCPENYGGGEESSFSVALTLLWAQMAEPRSFHVPPLRSIRSMRRICRKRRLRREVARTLPWFPTATTGTEAISTKMSGREDGGVAGEKEKKVRRRQWRHHRRWPPADAQALSPAVRNRDMGRTWSAGLFSCDKRGNRT